MIKGKNIPFWKKRLIANSRRVFFADINMVRSVANRATIAKESHHNGNCHQLGNADGEKFKIMFAKTILGKAISMANVERKPSIFSGMIPLFIIQNPKIPIPKSTATD